MTRDLLIENPADDTGHGSESAAEVDRSSAVTRTSPTVSIGTPRRRRRRGGLIAAATVAAVAVMFVAVLATSPSASDRNATNALVGKTGPEITGVTTADEYYRLSDRRGSWVVVNFFASWCIPCREEHPELVAFAEAHAAVGDAEIVTVAFDDTPTNVSDFFTEFGGDWPVIAEDTADTALDYGVIGVPETFVVAPDGIVVAKVIGGVTRAELDDAIARESAVDRAGDAL